MLNEFSRKVCFEKYFDQKLMINVIACSMLESPYTSDYDEMGNVDSKPTVLEPTIKHWMKETILGCRAAHNLVRRGQNIIAEISLMGKKLLWNQWEVARDIIQQQNDWEKKLLDV